LSRPALVDVEVVFDGGSLRNPGDGYGSYRLTIAGQPARLERRTFGRKTNNEAEYLALIAGLEDAVRTLERSGVSAQDARITVRGDSQLVLEQVKGAWKVRSPHLQLLRDTAASLLSKFGERELIWHARANSVRILGH
jgi:ribonuclease HI